MEQNSVPVRRNREVRSLALIAISLQESHDYQKIVDLTPATFLLRYNLNRSLHATVLD